MTIKEKACSIINNLPDDKVQHIVNILNDMALLYVEEEDPDEFDLHLIQEIENNENMEFVSLDDYVQKLGVNLDEL